MQGRLSWRSREARAIRRGHTRSGTVPSRKLCRSWCLAILSVAWCALSLAHSKGPDNGGTTLAGQLDLARLVDLAADRLRLSVTYDPQALRATVTIRAAASLTDEELWSLANQSLIAQGLATIRTPSATTGGSIGAAASVGTSWPPADTTFSVVKIAEAAQSARVEPERAIGESLFEGRAPGFATVVLRPRHATSKDLLEAVRALVSKAGGAASELGKDGLLLISDTTPRLTQIARVLESLDRPDPEVSIEEYHPGFVPAASLVASITTVTTKADVVRGHKAAGDVVVSSGGQSVIIVSPKNDLESWRALVKQLDQRQPVETRTYIPKIFAVRDVAKLIEQQVKEVPLPGVGTPDDRWRLVVDELTGSLVITAAPPQHEQIEAILARLDAAQGTAMPVRSFPIRNRPVSDVLKTLQNLIAAGVLDAATQTSPPPSSPLLPGPPGPSRATAENPIKAAVSPSASIGSTSLASPSPASSPASAGSSPSFRGQSLNLTADEGTNTLIAVGEPRLLAQLEALLKTIDVRQPQVMLEVMLVSLNDSDAKNLGIELERVNTSAGTTTRLSSLFGLSTASAVASQATRTVGDAAGFTGAVLNPGDYSVVVRALETVSRGRQSSLPRVLVNNNEQAQFSSTLQQPVITQRATDQTTTTSFAGFEDAGTKISIRPQIAEGDHLVLQYSLSLSSFVGSAAGGVPPPRQQNEVTSIATIPDGHTVVVGGLELVTNSDGGSQVPLIARIPILGELFRNRGTSMSTTRFYVFIRATVLRDQGFEDLKYLSGTAHAQAGVDDGWPVVEPRVIK